MDLLIKGMEMPKSCYECPFFKQVDYWNKSGEIDVLSKCKRTGEFTWESVNGYLPNCPLVPVQKHGRCIDVDKVLDKLAHNLGIRSLDYLTPSERAIVSWFRDAPTIIEAEGEKS
jgi:hypothetical protein